MQSPTAVIQQPIPWAMLGKMILFAIVIDIVVMLAVYRTFGIYTVQPIDTLPTGTTLVVWRASGEPFFDSPDGRCLQLVGEMSPMCRGLALSVAPTERAVLRLPYQHWAYLMSTGGLTLTR